jgi:hypothetical protein
VGVSATVGLGVKVAVAGARVGVSVGVSVTVGLGVKVAVAGKNVGARVGVSVGARVGVSVAVAVSVSVGERTWVGKDWVGVASRVSVGRRGVKVSVADGMVVGVWLAGGRVTRGVGVSETGGGALARAITPTQ